MKYCTFFAVDDGTNLIPAEADTYILSVHATHAEAVAFATPIDDQLSLDTATVIYTGVPTALRLGVFLVNGLPKLGDKVTSAGSLYQIVP